MAAKRELKPGAAFVLMLVMVCCALIYGSYKHWEERCDLAAMYFDSVDQQIDLNIRTAHNLHTVAARHLDADSTVLSSLKDVIGQMSDGEKELSYKVRMCERFAQIAKPLLESLVTLPTVQQDSRDYMYASQMLPQAVAECEKRDAFENYDLYAMSFNEERASTFTGLMAKIGGVDALQYAGYDSSEIIEMVK
ncbi:MAG: hypothetical protein IKW00_00095 [Clostridia bacterium]|nr:hypothetical protein [Clostridia bacterium]